jgi:hypothetical protein
LSDLPTISDSRTKTTYHVFITTTSSMGRSYDKLGERFNDLACALLYACDEIEDTKMFGGWDESSRIFIKVYRRKTGWFEKVRNPFYLRDLEPRKNDTLLMKGGAGKEPWRYV